MLKSACHSQFKQVTRKQSPGVRNTGPSLVCLLTVTTGGGKSHPPVKQQLQLVLQLHFADTDPSVGRRLLPQRQKKEV